MKEGKFNIIIGGQAGSESKGKLSGYLCEKCHPNLLVMTSSPNAGHTVVNQDGVKYVSYHLPVGSVMCDCSIVLGPASLINLNTFVEEIKDLGIDPSRIIIDPRASVITSANIKRELDVGLSNIGSTLQGIGECRTTKMKRDGTAILIDHVSDVLHKMGIRIEPTSPIINNTIRNDGIVLCETTQGFDLDLEHGINPIHCTSKMINPAMAMAEAGVSPAHLGTVYGVIRPYPIRVNNRTGYSGSYGSSNEISWEEVSKMCGSPEKLLELTTTTKLPRRVFDFCWDRIYKFAEICNPDQICLQFANYIDWSIYGKTEADSIPKLVEYWIKALEMRLVIPVTYVGTGPNHQHMIEL